MAGPSDVMRFARNAGVEVRLHEGLGSVRTTVEASQQLQRTEAEIGNTVLVTLRGEPLLVIVPGDRYVDGDRICRSLGAKPTEIALATQEEVRRLTGYEIGLLPPFGHDNPTPVLLDKEALGHEHLFLPAGSPDTLIELNPHALERLPDTRVGEWSRPKPTEAS